MEKDDTLPASQSPGVFLGVPEASSLVARRAAGVAGDSHTPRGPGAAARSESLPREAGSVVPCLLLAFAVPLT